MIPHIKILREPCVKCTRSQTNSGCMFHRRLCMLRDWLCICCTASRCGANRCRARYTASLAFFEALWSAGISHVFVNLGSDHPSIIEAIVTGQNEKKGHFPRIITCPNEVCSPVVLPSPFNAQADTMAFDLGRWSPCQWLTATLV